MAFRHALSPAERTGSPCADSCAPCHRDRVDFAACHQIARQSETRSTEELTSPLAPRLAEPGRPSFELPLAYGPPRVYVCECDERAAVPPLGARFFSIGRQMMIRDPTSFHPRQITSTRASCPGAPARRRSRVRSGASSVSASATYTASYADRFPRRSQTRCIRKLWG